MDAATVVGFLGLGLVMLANTGALFYWAGKVSQLLKDHERRITRLEV
jgi:hypothetical protein